MFAAESRVLLRPRVPQTTRPSPAPLPCSRNLACIFQPAPPLCHSTWLGVVCIKLEDQYLDTLGESLLVDIATLAAGTQLLRLQLPRCSRLTNLTLDTPRSHGEPAAPRHERLQLSV
jgi:hypothetical protein